MEAKVTNLKTSQLELNTGQIPGVPKNPRFIRDARFAALKKSIEDAPEMLTLRELIVYPLGKKYVVICGNMRLRTCREIGYKELPCKVLQEETPPEKLREYAIKDNNGFGEDDWDLLANEWDADELKDWGIELPTEWGGTEDDLNVFDDDGGTDETDEEYIARKKQEFADKIARGELSEEDEEYQQFLDKFVPKKTTDDCYTPENIYEVVASFVEKEYNVNRKDFERPFYPGGDYQKYDYPDGCIVIDNPPFSILAEIVSFYHKNRIKFFLFAPTLTLFSSSSSSYATALTVGAGITYENGASVNTSFLTNLGNQDIRLKSCPQLYGELKKANTENLKKLHRELPNYVYPKYIVTSAMVGIYSRLGIDFCVMKDESKQISILDSQKEYKKGIFGNGYIVGEQVASERERAERERAERERAERERAERERAEREKAYVWKLSDREKEIVKSLTH